MKERSEQRLVAGITDAAPPPGTDSEEKEAGQAPSGCQEMLAGREERRKLPKLPFQHEYGGGDDYYVRECYKEYYPVVEQFVLTGEEKKALTVTGTPGIGKSVFYAYFFERFWKAHPGEWIIVAISYERDSSVSELAVYEDGIEIKHYRVADSERLSKTLDSLEDAQILQIEQRKEGKEVNVKKILLLCDGPPKARRPNMVVFTSPNDEWFRKNDKDGHFLYMPLWTSEELQKSALVLGLGLDAAEIDKRVEIFGGTARYCLHRDQSEAMSAMVEAIEAITNATELANLLLGKMTDRICHRLVHFEPLVTNKGRRSTKLASSFVRTSLERRLQMLDFTAREQLRKSLGEMETTASLSGWIFEIDSHETLRQGCELRVTSLPEDGSTPVETSIPIATSNITDEFDVDTLSPSLVTYGPFHKPKAKTWESIDSLYLPKMDKPVSDMPAAKWNRANDGPLILFQMTISRRHPVNASGLVYVLSKLEFLERMEHVKLVFVVPSELVGAFKRQPIVLVSAVGTDSVRSVRGIGHTTSALLSKYGIQTIDDLEKEVNLRENIKKQKMTINTEKPTLTDEHPKRWAQIVKL